DLRWPDDALVGHHGRRRRIGHPQGDSSVLAGQVKAEREVRRGRRNAKRNVGRELLRPRREPGPENLVGTKARLRLRAWATPDVLDRAADGDLVIAFALDRELLLHLNRVRLSGAVDVHSYALRARDVEPWCDIRRCQHASAD